MRFAARLDQVPPYLFAEIERKIEAMRAEGADVISLGIGDPDLPTPPAVIEALQRAVAAPETHQYPSNRGLEAFRQAVSGFYRDRFDVEIDPETEVIPVLGGKEGVAHVALACLDPGDVCLSPDPGYPPYTSGPVFAGADVHYLPLAEENAFMPDLGSIPGDVAARANLLFFNYPNNPTGAVVADGFFERAVTFAREHDLIAVHDSSYTEIAFDGYRPPSFLATPGAKDVGAEIFSLSKGWNMTGWRIGWIAGNAQVVERYRQLKTNLDSGMFDALQHAARRGAHGGTGVPAGDVGGLPATARSDGGRARGDRDPRGAAARHAVHLGARAGRARLRELHRARPHAGGGDRLPGALVRPVRRGIRPDLPHGP